MTSGALRLPYVVTLEDGTTLDVVADQRDLAAWELHKDFRPPHEAPHTASRFWAWSAAKRAGDYEHAWARWSAEVIDVRDADQDDEQEGEQGPTPPSPGRKGRSAAS